MLTAIPSADDIGDVYLPFLLLDTLYEAEQMFLDRLDDGSSDAISVGESDGFPFGGSVQTQLYVFINLYFIDVLALYTLCR